MRWIIATIAVLAVLAPSSQAKGDCANLKAPSSLRHALKRAHGHRDGSISKGSIYFGRCGSTRYAIASFSKALADQPEKFRKRPGHGWKDFGDGFEAGCDAGARYPIPRDLVEIWGTCPDS